MAGGILRRVQSQIGVGCLQVAAWGFTRRYLPRLAPSIWKAIGPVWPDQPSVAGPPLNTTAGGDVDAGRNMGALRWKKDNGNEATEPCPDAGAATVLRKSQNGGVGGAAGALPTKLSVLRAVCFTEKRNGRPISLC